MSEKSRVVVLGANEPADVPGVAAITDMATLLFATTADDLRRILPGNEILLGWDFRADQLMDAWDAAKDLKWIHWSGAGVDAVLFPDLRQSTVTLTNTRGVFDRAMAEYALGLILAFAKKFPQTFAAKSTRDWAFSFSERIDGRTVLIVGTGSIGRCIGRLLRSVGMEVSGVGRSARAGDADFEHIHAVAGLNRVLGDADFVVSILPLTDATRGLFTTPQFKAMKSSARFINLGRGASVDEQALATALEQGEIAGAALDVFATEPLPQDSRLWELDNLIISPHMSGDYAGCQQAMVDTFVDNLRRYRSQLPLNNVVDKQSGFVSD